MVSTASCFAQKWVLGVLTGVSKRRCCCKLSTHMWMSGRLLLLTTVRDGTREKECEMCFLLFACFLMETKSGQILKEWSDSKKGEKDPLWVEEWQWSAYMNGYRGCGFDRGSSSSSFWKRFSFSVFPFSLHPFPFLVLEWLLIPPGLSFYVYVVCVTKRYMFFFFMTDWAVFVCLLIHWCMKGGDERKKMHVCVWELLKDAMFENVELSEPFKLVTTLLPPLDMRKNENVEVFFPSMFVLKTREITEKRYSKRYQIPESSLSTLVPSRDLRCHDFSAQTNRDCNLPTLLPLEDLKSSSAAGRNKRIFLLDSFVSFVLDPITIGHESSPLF